MISPEEFIDVLQKKDLVAPELIEHLRQQIARPSARLSAALIAKWLVDRGHLSRLLAQRLLDRAEEDSPADKLKAQGELSWEKQAKEDEEELGLAPLDDEIPSPSIRKKRPKSAPAPDRPAAKPKTPARPAGSRPAPQPPPSGLDPLEGLMDRDDLSAETIPTAAPLAPVGRRRRLFGLARRRGRRNWDSPLMLLGGGGLLLLVIALAALIWSLRGRGADELLKAAEEDYRAASYTQAIAKYEKYLESYGNRPGPEPSLARVRCGLAKLRQATDYSTDWTKSLAIAQEVLGEIAQEAAFQVEAQPELVAMLPKLAEELAGQAHKERNPTLVQKTEEAVALVNKYIRPSSRPVTKLADIDARLALTKREIARGEELEKAVAGMKRAVAAQQTAEAYRIHADLLKQYPRLIDDPKLRETVVEVSEAQLSEVTIVDEPRAAETSEPQAGTLASVALAPRTANAPVPNAEKHVIYAVAQGVAYGLDAASGKIVWRRRVGFADNGRSLAFPPTAMAPTPGSDAIMVDAERNEVLRVEAGTGKPRWRHAVGEPFDGHPVVAGERLLVPTRSGRLVRIDLQTGDSPGYVQFPQALRVAPAVDLRRSTIYQVAEHSNLFVVNLSDGRPKQVVYLGHDPGSVTVPPVILDNYLIVAENDGVKHATLRVLTLEPGKKDDPPVRLIQSARLQGHVDVAPQVSGVRVLVATDQAELYVFEISSKDPESPLAQVTQARAATEQSLDDRTSPEGLIRFPLFLGAQVWIADSQLTLYDVQSSKGRLQPRAVHHGRSATLQPPVMIGQTVFHVRRRMGLPGVLVSAVAPEAAEPLWEIHLAAPLAVKPMVDAAAERITAVTATGAVFHVETQSLQGQTVADRPTVALKPTELRGPVGAVAPLPGGAVALAVGKAAEQLSIYDPQDGPRLRLLYLPDTTLAARPLAFAGGLLVPCAVGQAYLLNPRSGDFLADPFQPPLPAGARVAWSDPIPLGDDEFLLAENGSGLYRIAVKAEPRAHLAVEAHAVLALPLASPLAVLGETVYGVDGSGSLATFKLPDLTPGKPRALGARNDWGPGRVGERVLLATADDQLHCLDAEGQMAWQVALPYGPLAGDPLATEGGFVLASQSGVVWCVEADTGKEAGKIEAGCPLATGPVALGDALLVGGDDGSLFKIQKP